MKVAIIGGSGKMGLWFTGLLLNDGMDVIITGRNKERLLEIRQQLGIKVTTDLLKAVNGVDLILLSVPIDSFGEIIKQLHSYILPNQIVMDITSVKVHPVEIMHKYLGDTLTLGTHPVFGPGAKGLRNQNFVLTPTNKKETDLAEKVKRYLEFRGAKVAMMSPQEHDKMVSIVLGLSHFIAIASADTLLNFSGLKQMSTIGGPTYKVLLTLAESVITEDPELYASLQMNLPDILDIEALFLKSTKTWGDIVKNTDKQGFIDRMIKIKDKMQQENPDFGKSYEDMYKLLEGL